MTITALGVLTRARNLLVEGWIQGDMYLRDPKGKPLAFCSLGALRAATGDPDGRSQPEGYVRAKELVRQSIPVLHPEIRTFEDGYVAITDWNDARARTQQQVLAVFDLAISTEKKAVTP